MSFNFDAMQLIIQSESPKTSDLEFIFDELEKGIFNISNKNYFITKNYADGFYWLYAQSGDKFPYSKEVFNVVDNLMVKTIYIGKSLCTNSDRLCTNSDLLCTNSDRFRLIQIQIIEHGFDLCLDRSSVRKV